MTNPKRISFLYTNIGRGHPAYLDGIVQAMRAPLGGDGLATDCHEVPTVSRGLSRMGWKLVSWIYRQSGRNGLFGYFYNRMRQNGAYERGGLVVKILGRDIRREFASGSDPLIVAHPLLVGILARRPNLIYQHGELVTPHEALVRGAALVFVPTPEVRKKFVSAGYRPEQVVVTGLCIEPDLLATAEQAYRDRTARLALDKPLAGLFMSSGAEPQEHITKLIASVTSCIRTGHRAVVIARFGGKLETEAGRFTGDLGSASDGRTGCTILSFNSRDEEDELVSRVFGEIDFLVAPPHERTNWALGLGLPMFALTPALGSFAPLNLSLLVHSGTTLALDDRRDAENLGSTIGELRASGRLAAMAEAGRGRYPIDGFDFIARYLSDRFSTAD